MTTRTFENGATVCDECRHQGGGGAILCPLHAAAEEMRALLAIVMHAIDERSPHWDTYRALLARVKP